MVSFCTLTSENLSEGPGIFAEQGLTGFKSWGRVYLANKTMTMPLNVWLAAVSVK